MRIDDLHISFTCVIFDQRVEPSPTFRDDYVHWTLIESQGSPDRWEPISLFHLEDAQGLVVLFGDV